MAHYYVYCSNILAAQSWQRLKSVYGFRLHNCKEWNNLQIMDTNNNAIWHICISIAKKVTTLSGISTCGLNLCSIMFQIYYAVYSSYTSTHSKFLYPILIHICIWYSVKHNILRLYKRMQWLARIEKRKLDTCIWFKGKIRTFFKCIYHKAYSMAGIIPH